MLANSVQTGLREKEKNTYPNVKPAKMPPNATRATAMPTFIQKLPLPGLSCGLPSTASSAVVVGRECRCGIFAAASTAILPSALPPPPARARARDRGIEGIYV